MKQNHHQYSKNALFTLGYRWLCTSLLPGPAWSRSSLQSCDRTKLLLECATFQLRAHNAHRDPSSLHHDTPQTSEAAPPLPYLSDYLSMHLTHSEANQPHVHLQLWKSPDPQTFALCSSLNGQWFRMNLTKEAYAPFHSAKALHTNTEKTAVSLQLS